MILDIKILIHRQYKITKNSEITIKTDRPTLEVQTLKEM